jgi:hypothetical protein
MASPVADSYSVASGAPVWAGRYPSGLLSGGASLGDVSAAGGMSTAAASQLSGSATLGEVSASGALRTSMFASISNFSNDAFVPTAAVGQPLMMELHGSGSNPLQVGAYYSATMLGDLAYPAGGDSTMYWALRTRTGPTGVVYTALQPRDRHPDNNDGASNLNSYHMGWTDGSTSPRQLHLYQERRMTELLRWVEQNYPQCSTTKRYLGGDSVGAWETMVYGIRRPDKFAALYPSRPRVRFSSTGSPNITIPDWNSTQITYDTTGTVPLISAIDGGGSSKDLLDSIAYAANTANRMPWVGWVLGWNDGYTTRADHVAFVAALRAAGRGFAFKWNNGDHSTAPSIDDIKASYYPGLFEIGVGYPLLTNCSTDGDPATDLTGGINIGFKWRNWTESAGAISFDLTNIIGAVTVDVSVITDIFTGSKTPQSISIPSANAWVSVTFAV